MKRHLAMLATLLLLGGETHKPSAAASTIIELKLRSSVFKHTRTLRVMLPPGYDDPRNRASRYQVVYFLDGIAAFDAWGVPAVAHDLWSRRLIPPAIFVGVDNGGSTRESTNTVRDRASEYLPYPDQSWGSPDAPVPRSSSFPAFLLNEVMPLINARFRTRPEPVATGLAGASYSAVAALYVGIHHPDRIGCLLLESPSLHIGNGRLLEEAKHTAAWPAAVYLGVGTKEGETRQAQVEMLSNVRGLYLHLTERKPLQRVRMELTEGGSHSYATWRERLPSALQWLLGDPSNDPLQRQVACGAGR